MKIFDFLGKVLVKKDEQNKMKIEFIKQNRSEVYMSNKETKDYDRKFDFMENNFEE